MRTHTPSSAHHLDLPVVQTQTARELPRLWPNLRPESKLQLAQQIGQLLLRLPH